MKYITAMKYSFNILFLIILILASCTDKEKRITFYEGGNTIKYETEYKNGLKDGVEIFYYPEGGIKLKTLWKGGKKNGVEEEYYKNGNRAAIRSFHNDIRIGDTNIFSESAKLLEIQYFDSSGRIIDFKKFEEDGSRRKSVYPLHWVNSDTVDIGDTVLFSSKLANVSDFRFNKGDFVRGSSFVHDENGRPFRLKDVIEIISSTNNFYEVKIIADRKGVNFVRGQIIIELNKDSLCWISIEHPYFVK